MIARWFRLLTALAFGGIGLAMGMVSPLASAQAASGSSQSGFTLQANTRVVLTDVTVTDRNGNPVPRLKTADFHIFDNKKPQQIASFEEHRQGDAAPWHEMPVAAGTYTNGYIEHPPGVVNIVFLDLTRLAIEDQMWLRGQLSKFIDALPSDEPIAMYARTGEASILLQNFTADHALLHAAVDRVMPRFPPPGGIYLNDFDTLEQMDAFFGQIPGRKNVLWFCGGSPLFLQLDFLSTVAYLNFDYGAIRAIYDELEKDRIAIYPIDARGLTVSLPPGMLAQHALMSETAQATGGRAFFDNNGIAAAARRILQQDGDYYTLTYTPEHFKYDNKWHDVRVSVSNGYYTLSYRRGYFADGSQPNAPAEKMDHPRTQLLAHGLTRAESPEEHRPIVFQASVIEGMVNPDRDFSASLAPEVTASAVHSGKTTFTVRVLLPLADFAVTTQNGRPTVESGAAVLAFNDHGTLTTKKGQRVTFSLTDVAVSHPEGKQLVMDVPVELGKGSVFLYVAVWDLRSHRMGTLEIPYEVSPTAKQASLQPSK